QHAAEGRFDLNGEEALWALLAEITLRKCGRWNRHFDTRKRGGYREAGKLEDLALDREPADPREPSPDDAGLRLGLLEPLLRGLDERARLICEIRLQGYAVADIAARAGCTETTVFHKPDLLKRRLRRSCPAEDD